MDLAKFFSSYSGLKQENWFGRVVCLMLLVVNLILAVAVFSRKETVVLVPPGLKERLSVAQDKADQKYRESWGLFFALLLGNATPRNTEFIIEEIEKYLAPSIYQEVMKAVFDQAGSLKENNVSTTFTPEQVVSDEKTGHVLVKGKLELSGGFGKPEKILKTFEFGISIRNFNPQITYLDAYDKKPKEEKPDEKKRKEHGNKGKKPGN